MNYINRLIIPLYSIFLFTYGVSAAQTQSDNSGRIGRKINARHEVHTTAELCGRYSSKPEIADYSHVRELFKGKAEIIQAMQGDPQSHQQLKEPITIKEIVREPRIRLEQSSDIFASGHNFTAATISNVRKPYDIPPNLNGWVGSEQYILMTYSIIRSFNKATGEPDDILNIDSSSFFGLRTGDVRIDYDRFAKCWYMSSESNSGLSLPTDIILAVSEDAVITKCTKWHFYTIPVDQLGRLAAFTDYQQLAVDQNAVYINMDVFNDSGHYVGTSAIVFQKSSLLEGNPLVTIFDSILGPEAALETEFVPPADNFDRNPQFGYMITSPYNLPVINEYPGRGNVLAFFRIVNPGSNNPILYPGPSDPITISVPLYAMNMVIPPYANAPHKGNLFGVNGYLQNGMFGHLEAPHVRNKQLYACHVIQVDQKGNSDPDGPFPLDRLGVRWYQFDLTGDPTGKGQGSETFATVPALVQYGTLYDNQDTLAPRNYYIPSIMTNKLEDLVICATVSGLDDYTDVVYTARSKDDSSGTLRDPVYLTNNNSELMNPYNYGPLRNPNDVNVGQRWGDESSLCPDPCNDLDIWSTGEWAAIYNGWGIQTTQLLPLNVPKQCVSPLAQALINKQCGC